MSQMIRVTLPDGSARDVVRGTTPAQIAADIGPGLAKAALAARIDGELRDIMRPLEEDTNLALVTSRDEADALELVRHDFAHILAEAVQNLFPGTQITFGPSTGDGFYYDFAPTAEHGPFRDEELPLIEEEMRRMIAADLPLTREVWERDKLIAKWQADGETFKAEWAAELPANEELTVYRSGDGWMDMCRGPHLASTGKLDPAAFKLTRVSGAYWRGDQKNAQLSRIYGTGWLNKKQLAEHLVRLEEAAKRDHRKLGQEMDLFHLQAEAHGSVFWHPKGYMIWRELEAYMRRAIDGAGYREVKTPQVMDARQWEQSGHWGKYRENMFVIPDEVPNVEDEGPIVSDDAEWMALKPMNCPAHVLIFRQGMKSYRDLPLRLYENGCCHRNEPHGALHGLMRVRQFTQDDAHIFCREDQIVSEVQAFCALADRIYKEFGFTYSIKLALRPEKRFGTEEMWDMAETELRAAVVAAGLEHAGIWLGRIAGRGRLLCAQARMASDRRDRPDLAGRDDPVRPRAARPPRRILHRRGWRAPPPGDAPPRDLRQLRTLHRHSDRAFRGQAAGVAGAGAGGRRDDRVSDADDYARDAAAQLAAAGIRVETDLRNEKINYKVREHSLAKVPFLLVVGKREADEGTVAIRTLGQEGQRIMPLAEAIAMLKGEATPPDLRH